MYWRDLSSTTDLNGHKSVGYFYQGYLIMEKYHVESTLRGMLCMNGPVLFKNVKVTPVKKKKKRLKNCAQLRKTKLTTKCNV